jgi:hypothetical protein
MSFAKDDRNASRTSGASLYKDLQNLGPSIWLKRRLQRARQTADGVGSMLATKRIISGGRRSSCDAVTFSSASAPASVRAVDISLPKTFRSRIILNTSKGEWPSMFLCC